MTTLKEHFNKYRTLYCVAGVVLLLVIFGQLYIRPPADFPSPAIITVEDGATLSHIGLILKDHKIIRSSVWFQNFAIMLGGERGIKAGDYYFNTPISVFSVAKRLVDGDSGLVPVKITVPEGYSVFDIAALCQNKFALFDSEKFIAMAEEGYLFPDTYFFTPNADYHSVISLMRRNFDTKIETIKPQLVAFKKPLKDVIIMASILEGEARMMETRRKIAGILWKRLRLGIPLQVDTAFQYVNGKNSYQLSSADLKIDSPYNTYKYKGLPPTPISNPGLDSMIAAVTPTNSDYLYFLSDTKGVMHYAKTFEEHVANKKLYIP